MNVTTAVYAITHAAASACQRSSVQLPLDQQPGLARQVGRAVHADVLDHAGSASSPTNRPPHKPAIPWV